MLLWKKGLYWFFIDRQRLGIEDDEIVSTTAYVAKKKKNEQITERLKLKLRASEEIRLQLKLDKNYLKYVKIKSNIPK